MREKVRYDNKRMTRSKMAVVQPRDEKGRFAGPVTVLIDESGDLGRSANSSKAFTMSATLTRNPKALTKIADKYPRNTRYRQGGPDELKYNGSSDFVRRSVLEDTMTTDPSIHAVVIGKSDMSRANDEKVYIATTNNLIENVMKDPMIKNEMSGVKVVYDNHKYLQNGRAERLTEEAAKKNGVRLSSKTEVVDSARCRGLQVHDFVAGAVGSKYNRHDDRDLKIIESKTKITRMKMK